MTTTDKPVDVIVGASDEYKINVKAHCPNCGTASLHTLCLHEVDQPKLVQCSDYKCHVVYVITTKLHATTNAFVVEGQEPTPPSKDNMSF